MTLFGMARRNPMMAIERRTLQALRSACAMLEQPPPAAVEVPKGASTADKARVSPAAFRRLIEIEPGLNYEASLDPWQRAAFEAMDPAWEYAAGVSDNVPHRRSFYRELPRGHSKTTDTAAEIVWAVLAAPNLIRGYVVAADEAQAGLTSEKAEKLVSLNRWLEEEVRVTRDVIKSKITGAECQILASNAGGIYGKEPNFVVCDELTVWKDPKVFDAMFSALPKVPRSIMVVNTNAGYGKGVSWQWKRREICRTSRFWWFQSLDGPQASWQTKESIEQQREELDPQEFQRLWLNKWLSGTSEGIPYNQIVNATRLPGPNMTRQHGCDFVLGGLDIGITHDRPALVWVGGHVANCKLKLLGHRTWNPKDYPNGEINLMDVRAAILADVERLGGIARIYADTWEATLLRQSIAERVDCEEVNFNSTFVVREMANRLARAFANGDLELFHDPVLERDLQSLALRMNDRTRTRVLHADRDENGHADSAFALAIAVLFGTAWIEELAESAARDAAVVHEFGQY